MTELNENSIILDYGNDAVNHYVEALLTENLESSIVEALDTNDYLIQEKQKQPVSHFVEPAPDVESGEFGLGLGFDLILKKQTGTVYAGDPSPEEVRQGFLGNCPLAAALIAASHVKSTRGIIKSMITEKTDQKIISERTRKPYEFFANERPKKFVTEKFQSPRIFFVRFRRRINRFDSVPVTTYLYFDNRAGVKQIHYMRSSRGNLWPCIIEKAYAVSRGDNSYQGINGTISLLMAMEDVVGPSTEFLINDVDSSNTISDQKLINLLSSHGRKPTIAGSLDTEEHDKIIKNHTYAVIGFDTSTKRVTLMEPQGDPKTDQPNKVIIDFKDFRRAFGEIVQQN